jgi:hypothetical protein
MAEDQARMSRSSHLRDELGRAYHLPMRELILAFWTASMALGEGTSGTASLSACAEAASVVTVLFNKGANALLRKGTPRLVRNARESIVASCNCVVKR